MSRRVLAWLCLMLLASAPFAVADDDEDDDKEGGREDDDDRHERDEERKLKVDLDGDKATIKLSRELAGLEDSVKVEFDSDKAKLQVKHEEKNETTESEAKLEARFRTLVEYVDANGNGAFDPSETIASAWALSEHDKDVKISSNGTVAWDDIAVTDVTSGNASGKKLSSRASFGPNATFGLDLFVYGAFTLIGNASLEPTETKIDIIIQHYPYVRGDTALAVIVDLKAKEEFKDDHADEDEEGVFSEMSEGNLTFRLAFTWLENATVDGVDRDVKATVLKDKQEAEDDEISQKARVALSYARGDLIVHDPTVGVEYTTQNASAREVPLPALALAVGAAALVAFARRRRQ